MEALPPRNEDGTFAVGNKIWECRSKHGPNPKYPKGKKGSDALWGDCVGYFEWVGNNPLISAETVKFQGTGAVMEVPFRRAMTIAGLCLYLGCTEETWGQWRASRTDLSEVITRAETVIRTQKFEGAAAGLFNPNIIARDLGLSDKQDIRGGLTININGEAANL